MGKRSRSDRVLAPTGLLMLAQRYVDAAEALGGRSPAVAPFFPVPHYLVAHAIELALKAFLSAKGMSEGALRALDHDLMEVLNRS